MDFVCFHSPVAKLHPAGIIPMKARYEGQIPMKARFEGQILEGQVMKGMAQNILRKMKSMRSFWKTEYLSRYFLLCVSGPHLMLIILFHALDSHKHLLHASTSLNFFMISQTTQTGSDQFWSRRTKIIIYFTPFLTPMSLCSLFSLRTNEKLRCVLLCVLFCV